MKNILKLNLIRNQDSIDGIKSFTGVAKLIDLIPHIETPVYDPQTKTGYQRIPKDNRIDAIKKRYLLDPNAPIFIDNVNFNIRSELTEKTNCLPVDKSRDGPGEFYIFNYNTDIGKFQTVDGQTRIWGADNAINFAKKNNKPKLLEDLKKITVAFNITFTANQYKESYIFYLINTHSKALPPDGASRLIYQGYMKGDVNFKNEVISLNKGFEIESMSITEKLNEESSIWSGLIKDFNSAANSGTIRGVAMSRMVIKPIYEFVHKKAKAYGLNNKENIKNACYNYFEAYWNAIKKIFPDMFLETESKSYNILKSSQSEVMTKLFIKILELSDETNKDYLKISDPRNVGKWESLLRKPLTTFSDQTENLTKVTGKDCWNVGKKGSMGKYSSGNAKEQIASRLYNHFKEEHGVKT